MRKWITTLLVLLLLSSCSVKKEETEEKNKEPKSNQEYLVQTDKLSIEHLHGIGYNENNELLIATHHGIILNREGEWFETSKNLHDYMGFQVIEKGFYSSGHPEAGSELKNPLGIMMASKYGENLEKVAFYGESDFHFFGASFYEDTLYLINEQPNSELEQGFYRSTDGGSSWEQPSMSGFDAKTYGTIAVHPNDGNIVAIATREGLFASNDGGETFSKWAEGMITAITFGQDEIFYSTVSDEGAIGLHAYMFESKESKQIPIPFLDFDNPITYLAASPKDSKRLTITTYEVDILQTEDRGENWDPLLQDGKK